MTQTEVLKMALEALTATMSTHGFRDAIDEAHDKAIIAIKEALAQQSNEQVEPVAWRWPYKFKDIGETGAYEYHSHEFACLAHLPKGEPLYTHPPVPTAQPKEPEQEQSGFFSREAMKAHSDFHVAQPEPEPFGYFRYDLRLDAWVLNRAGITGTPFYTTPPQRKPEQEPVAWRYKPARENNPRWEYTTEHPLDMGDGYLRPSLVEYCKCIEPLYSKEKPKLMLEKFREMKDLLDDTTPPPVAEPHKRKPLTDDEAFELIEQDYQMEEYAQAALRLIRRAEAAHGINE